MKGPDCRRYGTPGSPRAKARAMSQVQKTAEKPGVSLNL